MDKIFKPISDMILVKQIPKETKTESGIELSQAMVKTMPCKAEVMATGENTKTKKGDIILFANGIGLRLNINDIDYLLLREGQIYGILMDKKIKVI